MYQTRWNLSDGLPLKSDSSEHYRIILNRKANRYPNAIEINISDSKESDGIKEDCMIKFVQRQCLWFVSLCELRA